MRVLKFGGSSVADAGSMSRVLDIVEQAAATGKVTLVCSAISGCTDALIALGADAAAGGHGRAGILDPLRARHRAIVTRLFSGREKSRTMDRLDAVFGEISQLLDSITEAGAITPRQEEEIQTFGEILSTRILAAKLGTELPAVKWLDSRKLIVKGDLKRTYAGIRRATRTAKDVFVAPGFIARTADGAPATLGRGGSDYSAALYAAATGAPAVEIWTDVPGIMTANPKVVPEARPIPHMSYDAAFCMAGHGAKVLYAPTVTPAREKGIPILIKDTFTPSAPGTVIDGRGGCGGWVGVSSLTDGDYELIYITAEGAFDARGAQLRGIAALKDAGISAVGTGSGEGFVSLTVLKAVAKDACRTLHNEFF